MAKKTTGFGRQELDDLDLDFLSESRNTTQQDSRRAAVRRVATSFASGARDSFTNPSYVRRMAAKALPDGYGAVVNTAADARAMGKDLYDTVGEELKPALPAMRRATARILPKARRFLPEATARKLEAFTKEPGFHTRQQSDYDNDEMTAGIANVIGTQMEDEAHARAEDRAERAVRDAISARQHKGTIGALTAVRGNLEKLVAFQDQVTSRYMRKSLELQYRQYFATRDMLRLMTDVATRDKAFQQAVVHNTGLPDYAKLHTSEALKANFRDRLAGYAQKSAGQYVHGFTRNLTKNLKSQVREGARGFANAFTRSDDMREQMKSARDMGVDVKSEAMGQGGASILFDGLGLGDMMGDWASKKIRGKFNPNGKFSQSGARGGMYVSQLAQVLNGWAQRDPGEGFSVKGLLGRLFRNAVPRFGLDGNLGGSVLETADKAVPFDNLTRRSITEIIPGYLARILQSTESARLGKDVGALKYNLDRGEFTDMERAVKDVRKRVANDDNVRWTRDSYQNFMDKFDQSGDLTPDTRKAFMRQVMLNNLSGTEFTPDQFMKDNRTLSQLSPQQREELRAMIDKNYKQTNGDFDWAKFKPHADAATGLRSRVNDPKDILSVYMDAGQREVLEQMGIVKRQGRNTVVDYEKLLDMYLNDELPSPERFSYGPNDFVGPHGPSAADYGRNKARQVGAAVKDKVEDIYSAHSENPVIKAATLRAGKLYDAVSGKVIRTVDDIGGKVVDEHGNVILTTEEVAQGLSTRTRGLLDRAMSAAKNVLNTVRNTDITGLRNSASSVMGAARQQGYVGIHKVRDLYIKGKNSPALQASKLKAGEYRDQITGKVIESYDEIKGPVVDAAGNVVLSAEDFAHNLIDSAGKSYDHLRAKVQDRVESLKTKHDSAVGAGFGFGEGASGEKVSVEENGALIDLNRQQVALLEAAVETLMAIAANGLGGVGGEGGQGGMFRHGVLDRTVGRLGRWGMKGIRGAGSMFGSYLNVLRKGAGGILGAAGNAIGRVADIAGSRAKNPFDGARDVYVKGEKDPVLLAFKMRAGHYRNVDDGKMIKRVRNITGAVEDISRDPPEIVLSAEQFPHMYVRAKNGIVRFTLGKLGSLLRAGISGYASVAALPFKIMGGIADGLSSMVKKLNNKEMDVYRKGDHRSGKPLITAQGIKRRKYYFADTGKPVTDSTKIESIVREYGSNNIVIGEEDLDAGLVDYKGRPLRSGLQRLIGGIGSAVGGALSGAARLAGGVIKGYGSLIGGMFGAGGDLGGGIMKRMFGWFNPKEFGAQSSKQTKLLEQIYDVLDSRLPGKKYRAGSWQAKKAATEEEKKEKKAAKAEDERSNKFGIGGLMGWLKQKGSNLFGGGEDEDEDEDDGGGGGNTIIAGGGGGKDGKGKRGQTKGKRGGWRRNRRARQLRSQRAKARRPRGRFRGGFSPTGLAATAAMAVGGGAAIDALGGEDSTAGKVAGGAMDAIGLASTALWLKSMLGIGAGTAAASGGAVAGTAAAGTAAAGTAAAGGIGLGTVAAGVGGTLAAILASPITLTVAAIAAVGIAAYAGYKYMDNRVDYPMRKLRMAQYGIDSKNDVDNMVSLQKLEAELIEHVEYTSDGCRIDGRKVDIQKLFDVFDIENGWLWTTAKTRRKQTLFLRWVNERFKPVYLSWLFAAYKVKGSAADISAVDKDWRPEDRMALLKALRVPSHAFEVSESHMDADLLGPAQVQAVRDEVEEMLKAADKKAPQSKADFYKQAGKHLLTGSGIMAVMSVRAGMNFDEEASRKQRIAQGLLEADGTVPATSAAAVGRKVIRASTDIATVRAAKAATRSGEVSAFRAVRYRTYGLVELDPERMATLDNLERQALQSITFDGSGIAQYEGNPQDLCTDSLSDFGINGDDTSGRRRWMQWFNLRFMPTLLHYATVVRARVLADDFTNAERSLNAAQQLEVGVEVTKAKNGTTSVWTYGMSPWSENERANVDVKSTHPSILALREKVRTKGTKEESVAGKDAAVKNNKEALDAATAGGNSVTSRLKDWLFGSGDQRTMLGKTMDWAGNVGSSAMAGLRSAGSAVGNFASTAGAYVSGAPGAMGALGAAGAAASAIGRMISHPGGGTGGDITKLPMVEMGIKGASAMAPLISAAARMAGVDPALMMTMASIESAFNPTAQPRFRDGRLASSAKGLFQFIDGTWSDMMRDHAGKYGIAAGTSAFDPRANALLGAEFLKGNFRELKGALGRDPTDTEMYIAHFMGSGGAKQFLRQPHGAIAATINPAAARANPSLYYDNGRPRTVGEFIALMESKVSKHRESTARHVTPSFAGVTGGVRGASQTNDVAAPFPETGGNTTTTANGPDGGIASSYVPSLSSALGGGKSWSSIAEQPAWSATSTGATPVPSIDQSPGLIQDSASLDQSRNAFMQSSASAASYARQSASLEVGSFGQVQEVLQKQLEVQQQQLETQVRMSEQLDALNSNLVESSKATVAAVQSAQAVGAATQTPTPGSARGARPVEMAPQGLPINVRRHRRSITG